MGTISISLPTDGTTADVADVNTPLTTIKNVINGNLDNANIKVGAAIDGAKLAATTLTSDKMNLSKTTDANGWTKYDFGTFQQYIKKGSYAFTIGASAFTTVTYSANLPVGMTTIGTNFVTGSARSGDSAVSSSIGCFTSDTSIQGNLYNGYTGGSVINSVYWTACITTA